MFRGEEKIADTLSLGLPREIAREVAQSLASSGVYYETLFEEGAVPWSEKEAK
jgi:hypothetical protein